MRVWGLHVHCKEAEPLVWAAGPRLRCSAEESEQRHKSAELVG